jgi:hypothetical protein
VVYLCRIKQKADFFSHVIPSRYLPGIKVKKWKCFKKMKHLQEQPSLFFETPTHCRGKIPCSRHPSTTLQKSTQCFTHEDRLTTKRIIDALWS